MTQEPGPVWRPGAWSAMADKRPRVPERPAAEPARPPQPRPRRRAPAQQRAEVEYPGLLVPEATPARTTPLAPGTTPSFFLAPPPAVPRPPRPPIPLHQRPWNRPPYTEMRTP